MGGSSSKGIGRTRAGSQTVPKELLGQTIADLTGVSVDPETNPKSVIEDGNRDGYSHRGCAGLSKDRSGSSKDSTYPESTHTSTCRSDDSDLLSLEGADETPLLSLPGGHFINPKTLEPETRQNYDGPRTRARFVYPNNNSYYKLTYDQLISKWRDPGLHTERHELRQCILTRTIPQLQRNQRFVEISSFLKINDKIISTRVHAALWEFLFTRDDDMDVGRVLEMEEHVWAKLRQQQDRVFDFGLINLLFWSYLLCHPDIREKHADEIVYTSEERKISIQEFRKETQSTASKDLFKAMLSFHEDFPKRFAKRGPLSVGKDVQNMCDKRDEEILNLIKGAKFCDKITHLYSLIKQIMAAEHDCDNVLAYLKHILPSLIGTVYCGKTQTLSVLLVQGCKTALETMFPHADVQVGPTKSTTKRDLQELIVTTIVNQTKKNSLSSFLSCLNVAKYKRSFENRLSYILMESSSLIFHPAKCVRDPLHDLLCKLNPQSLLRLFIHEIEKSQANCGLRIDTRTSETDTYFQSLKGRMGDHQVIVHARLPSYDVLHNPNAENLVPPDRQTEREKHIHNLDMLRSIKSHPNIVELYAYQAKPSPYYYIVEDCQQITLQHLVLQNRERNAWLSDKKLCEITFDIKNGLAHLHKQNVVLRDLTLNNLFLVTNCVKIGDFSLSDVYKSKNNTPVKDLHPGDIPTRWTSPEALLEGEFSPMSDIWSLGLVLYALWTHGCEPYTEYNTFDTEEIMRKVVFEDLPPFQWPCIPGSVYTLLRQCMKKDPAERIELAVFHEVLDDFYKPLTESPQYSDTSQTTFEDIHARDRFYPLLDERQIRRNHVPEKGIPTFVDQYNKDKRENFINTRRHNWVWTVPVVSKESDELCAWDDLKLVPTEDAMTVKEPMTEQFVKRRLPYIEAAGIKCLNTGLPTLEKHGHNYYIQKSIYEPSDTLLEAALYKSFDSDVMFGNDSNVNRYLHMCLQVAESVQDMHRQGWIHRSLRAKNFLVNRQTREVYTCRVGRMICVSDADGENVQDSIHSADSNRWLPPEALFADIHSKKGDVYMLAMMIYEVLQAYQEENPRKNYVTVPYCLVPKTKLAMEKQNGNFMPRPDCCPEDLYNFLVRCWNPDRHMRPSIEEVVKFLRMRLHNEVQAHEKRLRRKNEVPQSPTTVASRVLPRKLSGTDGRSRFTRFRKFGKTVKRLFGPKPRTEPENCSSQIYEPAENLYASINRGFCWEDGSLAYEELTILKPDNEEDVIFDRLSSRRGTMLRNTSHDAGNNDSNFHDITTNRSGVLMRSKRGRNNGVKKSRRKQREKQLSVRNLTSSSASSCRAIISRRARQRRQLTSTVFQNIPVSEHPRSSINSVFLNPQMKEPLLEISICESDKTQGPVARNNICEGGPADSNGKSASTKTQNEISSVAHDPGGEDVSEALLNDRVLIPPDRNRDRSSCKERATYTTSRNGKRRAIKAHVTGCIEDGEVEEQEEGGMRSEERQGVGSKEPEDAGANTQHKLQGRRKEVTSCQATPAYGGTRKKDSYGPCKHLSELTSLQAEQHNVEISNGVSYATGFSTATGIEDVDVMKAVVTEPGIGDLDIDDKDEVTSRQETLCTEQEGVPSNVMINQTNRETYREDVGLGTSGQDVPRQSRNTRIRQSIVNGRSTDEENTCPKEVLVNHEMISQTSVSEIPPHILGKHTRHHNNTFTNHDRHRHNESKDRYINPATKETDSLSSMEGTKFESDDLACDHSDSSTCL